LLLAIYMASFRASKLHSFREVVIEALKPWSY